MDKTDKGVFGLGAITVDFIGKVSGWPEQDVKTLLTDLTITGGGLVGNAISTVARLGGKAFIAGRLGYSLTAKMAFQFLEEAGVNVQNILRIENAEPVRSFILTDPENGKRNIFFTRQNVSYPSPDEFPDPEWYRQASVLVIDHGTGESGYLTALEARKKGLDVVLDVERKEPEIEKLMEISNHIIVGRNFAASYSGTESEEKIFKYLRKSKDQVIVMTLGGEGLVGQDSNGVFRFPGLKINMVDSTGCGDVFHGAYAFGISMGWDTKKSCLLANAASALKATRTGGGANIPGRKEVLDFIRERNIPITPWYPMD